MSKKVNKSYSLEQEDNELIQEFQLNKSDAFDKLILKHKDKVFTLCFRMLGDYDEANDCAQEIFIKLYNNLSKFKFKSSFSTWLYRITINTCKNSISSLQYRIQKKMIHIDKSRNCEDEKKSNELSDQTFNPVNIFEKKEKEKIIQDAINTLPKKQKILVILRDIEGKSYDEIAKITGFKLGTVKSKLARARQHLREKLKGVI